ncbi:hypothetical protein ACTU3I_08305 [Microbacterium sp. RD1]|uniref:hypothetical protein n=1 Tax=Microbacterium sp. RD1 TaxID=3457313 RepID=UPI003FA5C435
MIRYQRFPVVELSIWPQDDGPDAVWMQVGLAMQDGVRLIPFDTSQAGPDVLDAELLAPLAEVAAAAYAWHDVLAARHRSVYTARYQRDGLPAPAWRALPG